MVPIIWAILVFGFLIFIHELGHFLAARSVGVRVYEFSIGMGPRLIKWGKKDTEYSLRLFPIGGFVRLEGEDEENDPLSTTSLVNKKKRYRFLVLAAGAMMNLLFGFIASAGLSITSEVLVSNTIGKFDDAAISVNYGLQVNDTVLEVNGKTVHVSTDLIYMIAEGKSPFALTVERDGEVLVLEGVCFPVVEVDGQTGSSPDFLLYSEPKTFGNLLRHTVFDGISIVRSVWRSIVGLFTGDIPLSSLSGPVGTGEVIAEAASMGIDTLLYFVVFISINLGIMNLLPIPALDGGQILILLIEAIIRRPVKREVVGVLNFISFALLILLMIFVTYKDILRVFFS